MDPATSPVPSTNALELHAMLARLGLDQYEQLLTQNGFDNWETLLEITESDMAELGFKLGDRRKLQRAIHDHNSAITPQLQNLPSSYRGLPILGGQSSESLLPSSPPARAKRRYRRHPRVDQNAPRKPKTAYVLFTEHVRTDSAISHLSFTEIAKEVGTRWKNLPQEERVKVWEEPVAEKMREYAAELEQYKTTENYRTHQTYLEEFKRGQQGPESTASSDSRGSPALGSARSGQQQALPSEKGLQVARHGDTVGPSIFSRLSLDSASQHLISPIESGMEEVGQVLRGLGVNPQYFRINAFPPEDMTKIALEAYVQGTGSLLYLWDHDEALNLIRSVYHPESGSTQPHATELFAMSAIGCYCDGETISTSVPDSFFQFFLSMLYSPLDICDLRRMRLFTCLAIYRFTNNVESARKLMLSALRIGRKLFTSPSFEVEFSEERARYWWNVFRSVIFLESWFAYNTGRESRVTEQDLILYRPSPSDATYPLKSFHPHVNQLGQLASYIALDLKRAPQAEVDQAQTHFESLNEWHRTLPPPMQLSRLNLGNLHAVNWHTKRSLLQLHMLFLGLFIEPYRTLLVDLGKSRLVDPFNKSKDQETLANIESQCVLGARQCARVASLLQVDNLIRSHCWVTMYTSFNGCLILLFSASQKLILLAEEGIGEDLSYASSHLNLLSFCSYNNPTTRALYTPLQIIYNEIREVVSSPTYRTMRELELVIRDVALVPPSYYSTIEGGREFSENVLDLAKRVVSLLQERVNV